MIDTEHFESGGKRSPVRNGGAMESLSSRYWKLADKNLGENKIMFNLMVSKMLLTPVGKLKIAAISFILCAAFLGFGAVTGKAQIKIGDVINLNSQYVERQTFLDSRGRVMDKPEFKGVSENVFVSTHTTPNRDKGSGGWKIVSADGKKNGVSLMYGDKIYLMNMYPDVGYLDVWSDKLPIFKFTNPNETDYAVFASKSNNRQNGSGTWIVSDGKYDKTPKEVKQNDLITLESKLFKDHYLEVNGGLGSASLPFKDYTGNVFLVFVTDKTGFYGNSEKWKIMLNK